jgi:hypothetical protein
VHVRGLERGSERLMHRWDKLRHANFVDS